VTPGSTTTTDVIQQAGRGTIYMTVAKAYFMVTGLATYVVLPRVLTVEQFGLYSVVVGVASVINAVVMNGTLQTVSRFVSQDVTRADAVKNKALQLQFLIGGGVSLAYFLLSPLMARFLNDSRLTSYFQLTALITMTYSLYAVFLGTVNGRREFFRQAILDSSYSTFKVIFVIGFAWFSHAVMGALAGWLLAGVCVLAISVVMVGRGESAGRIQARELLQFQSWLLVFTLIINLLQKVDLLLVKALSSSDPTLASDQAGYYNAVMTIANVVFQSIVAVTFVVFPLISEATFRADRAATKQYITQTLRFSLMVMALLATLFASNANGLLGLIYKPEYLAGADALRIAPFGMLMFGWLSVLCSIISSSGHPRISACLALITLIVDAILNALFIPAWGLTGAAAATLIAMSFGAVLGAVYVHLRFDARPAWLSIFRMASVAVIIFSTSHLFQAAGVIVLVKLTVQAMAFIVLLKVVKEIGAEEFDAIRRMLPKRWWK
jgi:stage V sporulation protein B